MSSSAAFVLELGFDVGVALRAGEHAVCLVVVVEALEDRIPLQVTWKLHGDVMEQAGGAGAVADLDWGGGLLAGVDALDPVSVLLGCCVQVNLVGADDGVEDLRITCHEWFDFDGRCTV